MIHNRSTTGPQKINKRPTIGIIGGRGKMGQYFKTLFEQSGYTVLISGRKTPLSPIQLAKKADVIIVSVPIDATEAVINQISPHIKSSGLLMDLTSFKAFPMKAMEKTKASYLGCHPIFGPTANIEGQLVVLCEGRGKKWLDWFSDFLKEKGAIVRKLTPAKHDEMMAYVQALIHFSDIALADTFRKSGIPIKQFIEHQSPIYRMELDLMGRILNQDPNLYASIQIQNPLSKKVLRQFIESCEALLKTIEKKDHASNVRYFENCSKYLGDFTETAMKESDRLLAYLNTEVTEEPVRLKKGDISVLGPRNTYSDTALQGYKPKAKALYAASIGEVFELVVSGKVQEGLVPLENSLGGSVAETLDELYQSDVSIEKVISLPIHLALIGIEKLKPSSIKKIYSHAQPFLQCRDYLKKFCPSASLIPVTSTASALERVAREGQGSSAAIGSGTAALQYGLSVIQDSIEDDESNTTFFAAIKKTSKSKVSPKAKKTSIAFHFKKDSPGSLHRVLQDFSEAKINLTKIESRPNRRVKGEYVFYVDFEGNQKNPVVKKALTLVRSKVAHLKILGVY
jgi:prephenate dehydratase/prephenate dehydrogenase